MPMSGFGSGFSFAKESTYGTPVTPTKAVPFLSESLSLTINRITANTLKGGNYLPTTSSTRLGPRSGSGDVQSLLHSHSTAALTEAMLGGIATTGTGPYTHTATMAASLPSYTLQVAVGGSSNTMRKTMEGAKVASWEIAIVANENVTLGLTWAYQDEVLATGQSLQGTYPTGDTVFSAVDFATLTIGGASYCVERLTFSGDNNLRTDSFCIGSTVANEPAAQRRTITGEAVVKLEPTLTALYTAFTGDTLMTIVATGTNGANTLSINATTKFNGSTPTVPGEDELTVTVPFEVYAASSDSGAFSIATTNNASAP